jgi:hypothetical protein
MDRQTITYYKIVSHDYIHHGFTYKLGLNIDSIKFNPADTCKPGGLYFTDFDNLGTYYKHGDLIAFIKIPSDAQVYKDPYGTKWKADRFIIEKFESIDPYWNIYNFCVKAVKKNGNALKYVKDQTPDLCLEAVKHNGRALKYVKDQTHEICLEAVKRNGHALRYVKTQPPLPERCLAAANQLLLYYNM